MQSEAMDRKGTFSFRCVADAVEPVTCPWQLCGGVTDLPPGLVIDLTTLGRDGDWVHWGRRDARDVDYMARPGGGPVSALSIVPHINDTTMHSALLWTGCPESMPCGCC